MKISHRSMRTTRRSVVWTLVVAALLLGLPLVAWASSVDVAVVDVTVPTASVTLSPGGNGSIVINMTVTGSQAGTATFKVNQDWTLSGGVFSGSNPRTFTVSPRAGGDPATTFSTAGTVTIAPAQGTGTFALNVSTFDITNSNTPGGKLADGADSNYLVTVAPPADTTPPVITVPDNMIVEAAGSTGAAVTFSFSATDHESTVTSLTASPTSGSTFPLGTTTVTVTATSAGGTTTKTFTVTVEDTTAPVLAAAPTNMTLEATSAAGAVATFGAATTATDLVDGAVAVLFSPVSGSTFPLGTTIVNYSATDAAGNTASGSFTVRVSYGWSGILQPINIGSQPKSIFKLGSTIPVKFQLTGASAGVTNASVRIYTNYTGSAAYPSAGEVEAVSTSAATVGNLFRYDSTSGQYIFNLSTKGMKDGDYDILIDWGAGKVVVAHIFLKK